MKNFPRKSLVLILIAIFLFIVSDKLFREIYFMLWTPENDLEFIWSIRKYFFILPLILLIWAGKIYFDFKKNNIDNIVTEEEISNSHNTENMNHIKEAGKYLINASTKFFIALGISLLGLTYIFIVVSLKGTPSDIADASKLSSFTSFVAFILGILAILDIKKAGKELNK